RPQDRFSVRPRPPELARQDRVQLDHHLGADTASAARSRSTSRARACFSGTPSSHWYARTFVSRNVVTGRSPGTRHRARHATTPRPLLVPASLVESSTKFPAATCRRSRSSSTPAYSRSRSARYWFTAPPLQRPDPSAPERLVVRHDRQVIHMFNVALDPCSTDRVDPEETAPLEGGNVVLKLPRTGRPPHSTAQLTS